MKFKDNFSEISLVAENNIMFYNEDKYLITNVHFTMKLIKIKDSFTDPYIQNAIAYMNVPCSELQKIFNTTEVHNLWSCLQLIGLENRSFLIRSIIYLLDYLFGAQFSVNGNVWTINNIEITEGLFNRIQDIVLVTNGVKKFNEQDIFKINKPQWLIEKEREIQRIKNSNKKINKTSNQHFEELMKVLIPINYELNYSFEDLFNMNYYHIQVLSKYIPKIVGYDIQKRQIMSKKKIKYITDK